MQQQTNDLLLSSGETVVVKRLSPFAQQAMMGKAKQLCPDPDPEAYRRPLANAAMEGLKEPAESNPAYGEAKRKAVLEQTREFRQMVFRSGVVLGVRDEAGEIEAHEATVARYAEQLAQLRAVIDLPEADAWLATLLYCLIGTHKDAQDIVQAAQGALVTEGDIAAAMDSFRRPVRRSIPQPHPDPQDPQGIPEPTA